MDVDDDALLEGWYDVALNEHNIQNDTTFGDSISTSLPSNEWQRKEDDVVSLECLPRNSIIIGSNTPTDKLPNTTLTKEYRLYFGKNYPRHIITGVAEFHDLINEFMKHVNVQSLSYYTEVRTKGVLEGFMKLKDGDIYENVAKDIKNRKPINSTRTIKDFQKLINEQRDELEKRKGDTRESHYIFFRTLLSSFENIIIALNPTQDAMMIAGYVKVLDSAWKNMIVTESKKLDQAKSSKRSLNNNKKRKKDSLSYPIVPVDKNDDTNKTPNEDTVTKLHEENTTSAKECAFLASTGNLNGLRHAHEIGTPWDEDTCKNAAKNGHLECLQYAHTNGCPWDVGTCSEAASNNHLNCLQYAHENGCPWNEMTCSNAAKNGHLECLRYAHESGCPWDKDTSRNAATNGHLNCLKYAHESGCPWDEWTCSNAAKNGYLDCLQYAHRNGCEWDKYTCNNAAKNGHLPCLQYAYENGCLFDVMALHATATKNNQPHILQWIESLQIYLAKIRNSKKNETNKGGTDRFTSKALEILTGTKV